MELLLPTAVEEITLTFMMTFLKVKELLQLDEHGFQLAVLFYYILLTNSITD